MIRLIRKILKKIKEEGNRKTTSVGPGGRVKNSCPKCGYYKSHIGPR